MALTLVHTSREVEELPTGNSAPNLSSSPIHDLLAEKGKKVMFAHLPHAIELLLRKDHETPWNNENFFSDTDRALEWCENQLLLEERHGAMHEFIVKPLADMDIVAGLNATELALLHSIIKEAHYAAGVTIIREGDPADSLFLLAAALLASGSGSAMAPGISA
jgi:hypothetical protein